MGYEYFSDRETGTKPRIIEEIPQNVWGGIVIAIQERLKDGSFGYTYPSFCPDFSSVIDGTDEQNFVVALQAEIDITWPLDKLSIPNIFAILDLIEFCYRSVAKVHQIDWHSYFRHHHLEFDSVEGKAQFREKINRIFSRNNIAFELTEEGKIIRLVPHELNQPLLDTEFETGDTDLDSLLNTARGKLISPKLEIRKESLEKLWDAWERLKTLEKGKDKRESIAKLLDKATTSPDFRERLDNEAKQLTEIGNNYRIRHSEMDKLQLEDSEQVDYLFHRLFALIYFLLRKTNRIIRQENPLNLDDIPF